MSQDALAAAGRIVAAFGAHDRAAYFSLFEPSATFLFYSSPFLTSRAAYEQEWARWEADGFRVLGCVSQDGRVDEVADGVAVFTHRVRTHVRDAGGEHHLDERETIVLRRGADGAWRGVHEHLSPTPPEAT